MYWAHKQQKKIVLKNHKQEGLVHMQLRVLLVLFVFALVVTWVSQDLLANQWCNFLLGPSKEGDLMLEVKQEALQMKDLIIYPFIDTYRNMSLKVCSLLSALFTCLVFIC